MRCMCCVVTAHIVCTCRALVQQPCMSNACALLLLCVCCAYCVHVLFIKRLLRMFLLGPICTAFAAHYFISILCAQLFACIAQFLFICCAYCLHVLDACSAYIAYVLRFVLCAYVGHLCICCAYPVRLWSGCCPFCCGP